jgi:hypothetical protein
MREHVWMIFFSFPNKTFSLYLQLPASYSKLSPVRNKILTEESFSGKDLPGKHYFLGKSLVWA